jgi:hypothetical protein
MAILTQNSARYFMPKIDHNDVFSENRLNYFAENWQKPLKIMFIALTPGR